ncbi:hypothetical protein [Clostridium sp. JN-1]|uniref:hypothetical protein n=1 Tax=Clostridium sp. JN-1 TaxID=2483110 RepID=UPI0016808459|nr:hypothetical protein [Clostridium sp. JN-1]
MNYRKIGIYSLIITLLAVIGCSSIQPASPKQEAAAPIPKYTLDSIIKKNVEPTSIPLSFGGKAFCDYKVIDSEKDNSTIKIYLFLLAQEYYVKDNKLLMGTGGDFTAVLTVKQENNNYKFVNCNISRAEETDESLKIFPKSVRKKAAKDPGFDDSSLKKLQKDAETYFKIKS